MLEPHRGQFVDGGPVWFGVINHHVALLAATLGRLDEAVDEFDMAVSAYESLNASSLAARAWIDWAQVLLIRNGAGDPQRARDLVRRAIHIAGELNTKHLAHRAASVFAANPL